MATIVDSVKVFADGVEKLCKRMDDKNPLAIMFDKKPGQWFLLRSENVEDLKRAAIEAKVVDPKNYPIRVPACKWGRMENGKFVEFGNLN